MLTVTGAPGVSMHVKHPDGSRTVVVFGDGWDAVLHITKSAAYTLRHEFRRAALTPTPEGG